MCAASEFGDRLQAWVDYTSAPWGRLRYAVVHDVLRRHLPEGSLDVLDVGGGDGLDARPLAALGHRVTAVDPDPAMVERARAAGLAAEVAGLDDLPGRAAVDLVLCHYVLQYRPDERADLRLLAGAVHPGGLVSIVLPNPDHRVLTTFLRAGPDAALAELDAPRAPTLTFGTEMRNIRREELLSLLDEAGLEGVTTYGGRVVGDLLQDNAVKHDPDFYASWERLELALAEREPYRRLGQFYGVLARRRR